MTGPHGVEFPENPADTAQAHQDWADRLNRLTGSTDYTADYVARTERQAGKPFAEITTEEFQTLAARAHLADLNRVVDLDSEDER